MPEDELAQIWELADLDGDGKLHLDEWAIAMHLVSRRVAGDPLPATLPSSLRPASSASRSSVGAGTGANAGAGGVDRWQLTAEHRALWATAFDGSVDASADGRMPRSRALRHLSRSGLPEEQLTRAIALVAPGSELSLDENQFVAAMLLVSKGEPLPASLPTALASMVAPRAAEPLPPPSGRKSPGTAAKAVSFAEHLAADVFAEEEPTFNLAAGGVGGPAQRPSPAARSAPTAQSAAQPPTLAGGVEDWLLVPAAGAPSRHEEASRQLAASVNGTNAAKAAVVVARTQVASRNREVEELQLRIEATDAQRDACERERDWCTQRLVALRSQAEEYAGSLREKQHELHITQLELEQIGLEVSAAQSRMASQLEEAQGLNAALEHAREEARALKQAQALLLQQAHVASKQLAPVRCELGQLHAEIAILKTQVEAAVAEGESRTGTGGEHRSVELVETQVDDARLHRQQLQDDLHALQQLQRQRAATEASRVADARRELTELQVRSLAQLTAAQHLRTRLAHAHAYTRARRARRLIAHVRPPRRPLCAALYLQRSRRLAAVGRRHACRRAPWRRLARRWA